MFKAVTVNLNVAESADLPTEARRIAEFIREIGPDIVALQGLHRGVVQSESYDVLTTLSDLTGMTYAFGEAYTDRDRRYGNGFLTRHPILEETNTLYPAGRNERPGGFLRLVLDIGGNEVGVMNTQFGPEADARDIAALKDLLPVPVGAPVLLLGSSEKLSGDDVAVAFSDILDDVWKRDVAGSGFTFPSRHPERRSEFILYTSGRPGFRVIMARILNPGTLMHTPVMAEFELVAY